ncbi:hypothetical protein GUJ93_ZPchr0005g15459 [Zizania palustris]|nr:hypothetical protein GUJ93_ZPchr0005g15459 [Zizania palustris]
MRDAGHDGDDDDAVPWLHYPVVDGDGDGDGDGDADTAPLPPDYCSAFLSGFSDLPAAVASREPCSSSHGAVVPTAPPPAEPVPKQPRQSGDGVMNFTFFSRLLQRPPGGDSASAAETTGIPVESTVVQTATNLLRSTPLFSEQRMAWLQPPKASSRAAAAAAPPAPLAPTSRQRETAAPPEPRAPEASPPAAMATTSSVCSGNGHRTHLKRSGGNQSAEWSASQDEDLDDEPGPLRRSAARSSKRSRTAEVHNMSERRRRDRINEKMRALQELIPNCNKIDKASMLEEAIEYLKTLQLQVQMMSMGTGLCVPPMLLPAAAALQHLQMQQMAPMAAHFSHLGAMGLGFGMAAGAFDMVPIPRLAGAQFPCPMYPGAPPMAMFGAPPAPAPFPHQATSAEQTPTHAAAPGGADAGGDVPVVPQVHIHTVSPRCSMPSTTVSDHDAIAASLSGTSEAAAQPHVTVPARPARRSIRAGGALRLHHLRLPLLHLCLLACSIRQRRIAELRLNCF